MKYFEKIFPRKNRILLRELVITDFKLRYQGSVLGVLWSVLKPLFLFAILYIVFDKFLALGKEVQHFPVYLLLGVVLWGFITEATVQGLNSIVARGDLIRKIAFPKYIIVISSTVSALINLLINLAVVLIFCLINRVGVTWEILWVIPLLIELYIFVLGIALLLSSLNSKYRDTGYLWEIFLQAAFYATPIIYPIQMVLSQSELVAKILFLNPVTQIIQDFRAVMVTSDTVTIWSLIGTWKSIIPFLVVIAVFIVGALYFNKSQKYFAENV